MKTYKIELNIKVSDKLIADGLNLASENILNQIEEQIREIASYAIYEVEFKVKAKVKRQPSDKEIEEIMNNDENF